MTPVDQALPSEFDLGREIGEIQGQLTRIERSVSKWDETCGRRRGDITRTVQTLTARVEGTTARIDRAKLVGAVLAGGIIAVTGQYHRVLLGWLGL